MRSEILARTRAKLTRVRLGRLSVGLLLAVTALVTLGAVPSALAAALPGWEGGSPWFSRSPNGLAQSAPTGGPAAEAVDPAHAPTDQPAGLGAAADVVGAKKVIVLRVYFDDRTATSRYTRAQVEGFFSQLDTLWRNTSYNRINIVSVVTDLFKLPDDRVDYIDDSPPCEPDPARRANGDLSCGDKYWKVLNDAIANSPAGIDWTNVDAVMVVMAETDATQFHRGQGTGDCNLRMGPGGDVKNVGCAIFSENPSDADIRIWGRWAHEIGHAFQEGGPAHPSNYDNPFELMDANYPGQVGAFEKQSHTGFPGWLPGGKYQTFTPSCAVGPAPCTGVGGGIANVYAVEYDPAGRPNAQAVKAYVTNNLYYLVSVRRKVLGDDLNGFYTPNGIPDEGVLIERVSEGSDKWVEVKGNGDRDRLWKAGDTYNGGTDGVFIEVLKKIDDDNYQVLVRYSQDYAFQADVMLNPWVSPPGNTWETTDIWIDSPLNGYGTFRYGTWDDGTGNLVPRGNGDDPAIGQVNRVYARVRNIGARPASNVVARFEITDPPGVGIAGSNGWLSLGSATSAQFPTLATINPGAFADVYIEWTPNFPISADDLAAGRFSFHTCLRVKLDTVAGETVIGNQDGDREQENISYFQAPSPIEPTRPYSDVIRLRNDDLVNRKFFYLSYKSDLPADWRLDVNGGVMGLELGPGELRELPVRIEPGTSAGVGAIHGVDVMASSQRMLVNSKNALDAHPEFKPLGGVRVEARVLQSTKLSCEAYRNSQRQVFVRGRLDNLHPYYDPKNPPKVAIQGLDDKRTLLPASLATVPVGEDGSFAGYLNPKSEVEPAEAICFFAGTNRLASSSSGIIPIRAGGPRVAYIYNTDLTARNNFNSFLTSAGFTVDLVPITDTATFDFSPELAIVVGDDTGLLSNWGSPSAVSRVAGSGKPIVGVGEGGYAFFGRLGLNIGWPNAAHGSDYRIYAIDPGQSIYSSPRTVTMPISRTLDLYTRSHNVVEVYVPSSPPAGVTLIGRDYSDRAYYPLLAEGRCYLLWGFSESPSLMTATGRNLFINALFFQSCQSVATATPTPTKSPTDTPTPQPNITQSPTATTPITGQVTPTFTPTPTPTPSKTPTPTATRQGTTVEPFDDPNVCLIGQRVPFFITFDDLPAATHVTDQYTTFGVRFLDDATTTPLIYGNTAERTTASNPNSLANDADHPNTSANVPLTMFFDRPRAVVGMYLGNGDADFPPTAVIRAYDAGGTFLGQVSTPVNSNDVLQFYGIAHPGGAISRIELDYGGTLRSEEIDNLCFWGFDPTTGTPTPTATPRTDATRTPTPTGTPSLNTRPVIIDVAPRHGSNTVATEIKIRGDNFHQGARAALIGPSGETPLGGVVVDSEHEMYATVPAGLVPDLYDLKVTNIDGAFDWFSQAFEVIGAAPVPRAVQPDRGFNDGPTEIQVIGNNFLEGILIGLRLGTSTTVLTETKRIDNSTLFAIVPAGLPAGSYDVVLTNPGGGQANTGILEHGYTVLSTLGDDFAIDSGDIWTDPLTLRQGMTFTLGLNIHRSGGQATLPAVPVRLFLGDPNAGGRLIADLATGPFPPGGDETVFVDWGDGSLVGAVRIYAVVDPNNTITETTKLNNVAARSITILPSDTADRVAPTIDRLILNNGVARTNTTLISVTVQASDPAPSSGLARMYLIEREFNPSARAWVPISTTGWISYNVQTSFRLTERPGLRFIQAYVADGAGNISTEIVRRPINYVPPRDTVRANQLRLLRFALASGESIRVRVQPTSGDVDLYAWGAGGAPAGSSLNLGTAADEVTLNGPGNFQVEVFGFADSTYDLSVSSGGGSSVEPNASSVRAGESKTPRSGPIVDPANEPDGRTAVPQAPLSDSTTPASSVFLPLIGRGSGPGW